MTEEAWGARPSLNFTIGGLPARKKKKRSGRCRINRRSLILQLKPSLLFLLLVGRFLDEALLGLAFGDHEMIVIAIVPPRSGRHIAHFHELPVGNVGGR